MSEELELSIFDYLPFITGSHAYGTPHENSDIDLVILLDKEEDTNLLRNQLFDYKHSINKYVRSGKINLLICDSSVEFQCWKEGTEFLITEKNSTGKPVTRDRAVKVFSELREKYGIQTVYTDAAMELLHRQPPLLPYESKNALIGPLDYHFDE